MSGIIRLLLVEDQQLVRGALKLALQQDGVIEVIAEAASGHEALELAARLQPDIVVINVMLPDMECIGLTERFRQLAPMTGIVILTAMAIDIFHRALQTLRGLGILGFITRNSAVEELGRAIHEVRQGREFLSGDIVEYLLFPDRRHEVSFILDKFTDREFQVLLLVSQGKRNKEISPLMYISPKTVSTYKQRVYDRLSIDNDVQLLHWALHHNLVDRQYPVN